MRTIETTVYQFDELPTERAKERAREWYRSVSDDDADQFEGDRDGLQDAVSDLDGIKWQTKETGKDLIDINRVEQTGGF